jgi:hypothetical protein
MWILQGTVYYIISQRNYGFLFCIVYVFLEHIPVYYSKATTDTKHKHVHDIVCSYNVYTGLALHMAYARFKTLLY